MPGRRDLIGLTPLEYTELNWQSSPFGSQSHSSFSGILSCNCSIDFAGVDVRRFYTDKAWTKCVGLPMSFLCISGCLEYCWILLDILIFLFSLGVCLSHTILICWNTLRSWRDRHLENCVLERHVCSNFPTSHPQEMKVDDLLMISKLGQEQSDPSNCSVPWGFADVRARVGSCVPETKVRWAAC